MKFSRKRPNTSTAENGKDLTSFPLSLSLYASKAAKSQLFTIELILILQHHRLS